MTTAPIVEGRMAFPRAADYAPLHGVIPLNGIPVDGRWVSRSQFVFMGHVARRDAGDPIRRYKHASGRYLDLDGEGRAFRYEVNLTESTDVLVFTEGTLDDALRRVCGLAP